MSSSIDRNDQHLYNSKDLERMISAYYSHLIANSDPEFHPEFELRFAGTVTGNPEKSIRPITQIDYDHVLQEIKSHNPIAFDAATEGEDLLRIYPFYGRKQSEFRCEITGMRDIQIYCRTNDWKSCPSARFVKKERVTHNGNPIKDLFINGYGVKASYKSELVYSGERINTEPRLKEIATNWDKLDKTFRQIHRTSIIAGKNRTFTIDASIVRSSSQSGSGEFIPVKNIHQSGVFQNPKKYELEIEFNNQAIRQFEEDMPESFATKVIMSDLLQIDGPFRQILMGLQQTMYPITCYEMSAALDSYYRILYNMTNSKKYKTIYDKVSPGSFTNPKNFIGPSLVGLEFENITEEIVENIPNIRNEYAVTVKLDGERALLLVCHNTGRVYMIDMNMNVKYTGNTVMLEFGGSIFDGEYVSHNSLGHCIHTLYLFDMYFLCGVNVRDLPLFTPPTIKQNLNIAKPLEITERYLTMFRYITRVFDPTQPHLKKMYTNALNVTSKKILYPMLEGDTSNEIPLHNNIFECCKEILEDVAQPCNTDGIIFIPRYFGVGASAKAPNVAGPLKKTRWGYNMKWKPAQYNTNDFLVTFKNGDDKVKEIPLPNTNLTKSSSIIQYKVLELRCGFSQKNSGFVNACQYTLNPKGIHTAINMLEDKYQYSPTLFYPSDYPDDSAHICYVPLNPDTLQMVTEEGDVFQDNMIVEFRYNKENRFGFRWIPLRVRYDKTAEYQSGGRSYGNDYETANGNWRTIQCPITESMITTGENIPTIQELGHSRDVYYNKKNAGDRDTLQKFHNEIKLKLIKDNSLPGQTLIDFACGKGGDLWKWEDAKLHFVFGIDYSRDNIENRFDGACARYLGNKKRGMKTDCLFVVGDSSKNIRNGTALLNQRQKEITRNVLGIRSKAENMIGDLYGIGADGFNIGSCQFALHYFFKDILTLSSFMTNLVQNIKLGGVFIGTCFDGKKIFEEFQKINLDEITLYAQEDILYWRCVKKYESNIFQDDSSSLGYAIDVFQKSIGLVFTEYLVNFDYLNRVMENYGFERVSIVPFDQYRKELHNNSLKIEPHEARVSSMNVGFVYKKIREVDPTIVVLEDIKVEEPLLPAVNEDKNEEAKLKEMIAEELQGNRPKAIEEEPVLFAPEVKKKQQKNKKCKDTEELVDDKCLKKCEPDQERHPETKRCRKIPIKKKKEAPGKNAVINIEELNLPPEVRSPKLDKSPTPQEQIKQQFNLADDVAEEKEPEQLDIPIPSPNLQQNPLVENIEPMQPMQLPQSPPKAPKQIKKTRKCKETEELVDDKCLKKCEPNQVRNQVTKRCNKKK